MKLPIFSVLIVALSFLRQTHADLLVLPNEGGKFTISTGQVAFVSTFLRASSVTATIGTNTVTAGFDDDHAFSSLILAGPLEMSFPSSAAISYRLVTNDNFHSVIVSSDYLEINVPTGKTLHIVASSLKKGSGGPYINLIIVKGAIGAGQLLLVGPAEFEGPATVVMTQGPFQAGPDLVTYYFTDSAVVLPDSAGVQTLPGQAQITVEKSKDLQNWSSSILLPVASDEKSFFRLKGQ